MAKKKKNPVFQRMSIPEYLKTIKGKYDVRSLKAMEDLHEKGFKVAYRGRWPSEVQFVRKGERVTGKRPAGEITAIVMVSMKYEGFTKGARRSHKTGQKTVHHWEQNVTTIKEFPVIRPIMDLSYQFGEKDFSQKMDILREASAKGDILFDRNIKPLVFLGYYYNDQESDDDEGEDDFEF